jgi:CMP-N,N'-diacetyllegionaminic acid synthase
VTYTLGTICARGGSQGVPKKNIKTLAGHPLIAYSIAHAKSCAFIDRLVVSTDDAEIAQVARDYGSEVVLRPAELATHTSAKVPAIQHAVREVERTLGYEVDFVVDLDPTAPLRSIVDITACWELVQLADTDNVFTVMEADRNPYFNMVELDGTGYAHYSKRASPPVVRRQDAPKVWSMNASVYAYRRKHLRHDGRVVGDRTRIVEMPSERSRDIDGPLDFAFVEFLVREGYAMLPAVTR